ncbi:MAG: PorT family protein [Pseudoflavonifractor sp.]|nr:PorT family protein [Alloprevotella sp.]MCM1117110.1 PorT family protein [Pseudoflavonifractor sp.]
MHRLLACLLILATASLAALSQRTYDPHFWIGGRAGMTLSRMEFSPPVDQAMTPGKAIAISVRYTEEKLFGLVSELAITQRGWREDFDEKNDLFKYDRHITYIELPVMTHIYFGSRKWKCFFNAGPSVAYMISDKTKANFDYENPLSVSGFPYTHRTDQMSMPVKNKFDYGIQAGLGLEFFFGRNSVFLEGRYYYGLGGIYPSHKSDVFTSSRGSSIIVSAGYYFRVK